VSAGGPARRPARRSVGRRVVVGLRVVLGLVVVASFLDVGPVRAQDADGGAGGGATETLAGYQGSAAASGVHVFYNPEGVLPIPPPVDLGVPDALATIASGPSTFARASVADPGDLLNSPAALFGLLAPGGPGDAIPPYPYRITATSGVGQPDVTSNPAPGLTARVRVSDGGSVAQSSVGVADAPAIATVGAARSLASTDVQDGKVTVHARTEVAGLDLLGILKVESITTDLTATSTGGRTELSGGTKIGGATVLGQAVTIDEGGVTLAPGSSPLLGGVLGPLVGSVDQLLKQVGITVSVAGPVSLDGGSDGQLSSTGLRIDLALNRTTFPALTALLDSLPPLDSPVPGLPSIDDLLVVAQANHVASLELGRGVVSLAGSSAGDAGDDGAPVDLGGGTDAGGSFDVPSSTDGSFAVTPTSPGGVSAPIGSTGGRAASTTVPQGAGVGALVLLAILAVPFIGERLAWICTSVLGAGGAERCTWEGP
jgi:hypothetical protein